MENSETVYCAWCHTDTGFDAPRATGSYRIPCPACQGATLVSAKTATRNPPRVIVGRDLRQPRWIGPK